MISTEAGQATGPASPGKPPAPQAAGEAAHFLAIGQRASKAGPGTTVRV